MSFKLGKSRRPYMTNGIIKSKLSFDKEGGDSNVSVPGTPVIRKPLAPGVMGEANMDGTIFISDKIVPGSKEEKEVVNHDDFVKYDGTIYERKDINGKDMIIVDGVAKEAGDHDFPWENDANNGK